MSGNNKQKQQNPNQYDDMENDMTSLNESKKFDSNSFFKRLNEKKTELKVLEKDVTQFKKQWEDTKRDIRQANQNPNTTTQKRK